MNRKTEPPPRLLPELPLPPYSYVTGKFPHPIRDPAGHSFGHAAETAAPAEPARWRQCRQYVRGIDLFNFGYYWEAHESWEAVWNAAGREGPVADFCKALVKLAAAGVKAREGRREGVRRHAERAAQLLDELREMSGAKTTRFMGLDVAGLIDDARRLANSPDSIVNETDEPVLVVMPFFLNPTG